MGDIFLANMKAVNNEEDGWSFFADVPDITWVALGDLGEQAPGCWYSGLTPDGYEHSR